MIRRVHIRVSGTDTEMYLFPEQDVPEDVTACSHEQLPEVVGRSYRVYEDLVIIWNDDEQIPALIDTVEFEANLKTLVAPIKESDEILEEESTEDSETTSTSKFEVVQPSLTEPEQEAPALPKKKEPEVLNKSKDPMPLDRVEDIKVLSSRHKLGKVEVERVARTVCAATNVNFTFTIEKDDFKDRVLPEDIIIRKVSPTHYNMNGGLPMPIYSGKRGVSVHKKYLPGAGLPYQISSNELGSIKAFRPWKSRLR